MNNSNSQTSTDGSRDDELLTDEKLNEASGGFLGGIAGIFGIGVINGADQAKLNAATTRDLDVLHESQSIRRHAQAKRELHAQEAINAQKEEKLKKDLDGLDLSKMEDFQDYTNSTNH